MSNSNTRRGLHYIRDHVDLKNAVAEVARIRGDQTSTADDITYVMRLEEKIGLFRTYAAETDGTRPSPAELLAYLMTYVKQVLPEQAAKDTGITDLQSILLRRRLPTAAEATQLANYFEVTPDAFLPEGK